MSGIRTNESLVVVRTNGGGLSMDTYKSELDCVLKLINNGMLGHSLAAPGTWGGGWGSDEHKKAIAQVEAHIVEVKAAIAEDDRLQALHESRAEAGLCQDCGETGCKGECVENES